MARLTAWELRSVGSLRGCSQRRTDSDRRSSGRSDSVTNFPHTSTPISSVNPMGIDSVHQTGSAYRSNNAGDGPEKTRDRKSWFPRFKSNWLGTFRSKQMFLCCECAVSGPSSSPSLPGLPAEHQSATGARYKGAEGKHCMCGRDQWHLAKAVEEAEYNRRMEISKALGGMRYDEAAARLRSLGVPESNLDRIRGTFAADSAVLMNQSDGPQPHQAYGAPVKRSRAPSASIASRTSCEVDVCSSPLSSASTLSSSSSPSSLGMSTVPMAVSYSSSTHQHHYPQANYPPQPAMKDYASPYVNGGYSPLHVNYSNTHGAGHGMTAAGYDHYVTAAFTDEEGFGELLQGILEDEPRQPVGSSAVYASSHQSLPPPSRMGSFSAGMPLGNSVMTPSSSSLSAPARPTLAFPGAPMVPEHDHMAAYNSHALGQSSSGHYSGGVLSPPSSSTTSTSMPMTNRFLSELPTYGAGRPTQSYVPPATAMAGVSGYSTVV